MINESPFFVRWRSTEVMNPLRVVASYSLPDFFRTDNRNPLRKVSNSAGGKFSILFLRREKRQKQRQVPFGLQEIFLRLYLYAKRIFQS